MSEARALHQSILDCAKAGDHVQVVDVAERYLDQFADSDDVEQRSLTAGVVVTWLSSKANLAPAEALVACDEVFGRYRTLADYEALAVAAAALRIKAGVLLRTSEPQLAAEAAGQLSSFFETLEDSADLVQPSGQLIATGKNFLQANQSHTAITLFKVVVQRLAQRTDPKPRQLAALAQLWLLLAVVRDGDLEPAMAELQTLDVLDDDAARAIDVLLHELREQQPWRWAMIMLIGMKIDALDARGDTDRARETRQGFIEAFDGQWKDIPAVAVLVEKCRADLASA
jgi:hypothetical protein